MSGGMDPLLLNGMYDQGAVRQHVNAQVTTGSASSVALPAPGQKTQVLALPAPDGSMQTVGGDPFAASLTIPPPSYVQMADLEKKQQFLTQEQMMWQQYQRDGMQGQSSLNRLDRAYNNGFAPNPAMPYGMPAAYNTNPMPMAYTGNTGYYYPTY
uniref:Clathrin assembly protein n=1 Tax=Arundo donax TaxID=35708 RepID=A0A0A9EJP1_ARUDO